MMKKTEALAEIKQVIQEMKPILDEAKVQPYHLNIHDESLTVKHAVIMAAHRWIKNIHKTEYADVVAIKRLLPQEIWDRYKTWEGFDEHREVILLKEQLVQLRKVVVSRKRPDFFKKGAMNGLVKKAKKEA